MATNAIELVRNELVQMTPQFQKVLPKHIASEKFVRVAMTAIQQAPDLLECSRQSLFAATMKCATDGLVPDGREAVLVKFNSKTGPTCSYIQMIGGILKKLRNSGEMLTICAHVVREGDKFEYYVDQDGEHFSHHPNLFTDTLGKIKLVYALAKTKDGGVYFEHMSVGDVEKVRQSSRAANAGPWVAWWDEMAKKSVLKRLAKRLPMSTDIEGTFTEDEEYDTPTNEVAQQAVAQSNQSTVLDAKVISNGAPSLPATTAQTAATAATAATQARRGRPRATAAETTQMPVATQQQAPAQQVQPPALKQATPAALPPPPASPAPSVPQPIEAEEQGAAGDQSDQDDQGDLPWDGGSAVPEKGDSQASPPPAPPAPPAPPVKVTKPVDPLAVAPVPQPVQQPEQAKAETANQGEVATDVPVTIVSSAKVVNAAKETIGYNVTVEGGTQYTTPKLDVAMKAKSIKDRKRRASISYMIQPQTGLKEITDISELAEAMTPEELANDQL